MSPALTYTPAYIGLFAAQILALACNSFLDIQYGGFGTEVLLWAVAFAWTLWIGKLQKGETSEEGQRWMKRFLVFGAIISLIVFVPVWGFPRAGMYMLAMLQVSYNCVTTNRRQLHMSLMISLVMVLFAASHYRADWTMLFYLIPYVVAVVFTLVAEQINRKAKEFQRESLGHQVVGAQGVAIAAATLVILLLGMLFYSITPQVTWDSIEWRWGQPGGYSAGGSKLQSGASGSQPGGNTGSGAGGQTLGAGAKGRGEPAWGAAGEMRKAAARKGMPAWQSSAINAMADLAEGMQKIMQPAIGACTDWWNRFKEWLKENLENIISVFMLLFALALLYAVWRLLREARVGVWLRTRFDYIYIVILKIPGEDLHGANICYDAMIRLFDLHEVKRGAAINTQEYWRAISNYYRHLKVETWEVTRLYEGARYGQIVADNQVSQMGSLYRHIFRSITNL